MLGIRLLRLPNGLVLEDPDGFVGRVREAIGRGHGTTPHPSRFPMKGIGTAGHPLPKGEGSLST